jgi:protein-L-isoaspartate O-methyltransferase
MPSVRTSLVRKAEIGTGTCWTSTLLASRRGVKVTTIEVDPQVPEQAAALCLTTPVAPQLAT